MRKARLNNAQWLVLAFLSFAWLSLIVVLAAAPEVYEQTLRVRSERDARPTEWLFLGALSMLILLIVVSVLRRWRCAFWLLLVAFLSGILRVPATILELAGWIPATGPGWYVMFQALIGIVQFAIGIVLVVQYRRYGVWGRRP
jgi:hypothetical protein